MLRINKAFLLLMDKSILMPRLVLSELLSNSLSVFFCFFSSASWSDIKNIFFFGNTFYCIRFYHLNNYLYLFQKLKFLHRYYVKLYYLNKWIKNIGLLYHVILHSIYVIKLSLYLLLYDNLNPKPKLFQLNMYLPKFNVVKVFWS